MVKEGERTENEARERKRKQKGNLGGVGHSSGRDSDQRKRVDPDASDVWRRNQID